VVAVVFSVVGAFYYLRIVKLMYFDAPEDTAPLAPAADVKVLMSLNGAAVLIFGIMPQPLMALCLYSIQASL
jgi:NADH-quinone oxidoreductase subunit N